MKIARKLKQDKRSKMRVKADVLATKVLLQIDNLTLNLSHIEARRVANTLHKAVNIQLTHRKETVPSTLPSTQIILQEKIPELTTLERRTELCRYIYQVLKEEHMDLPKYKESKINPHSVKTCDGKLTHSYAHCHNSSRGKYKYRICIKQKLLLDPLYRKKPKYPIEDVKLNDVYENLADLMAHEMAHLKINSCSHCKKWRIRYELLNKTIINSIRKGDFLKSMPENLKE